MKKLVLEENKSKKNLHRFIDWFLHIIVYAVILIVMSLLFKNTIYIESFYGLWGLLATIIIYLLNKTVKPIIVWLTLPITGLTLGLFYPFINVLILYVTDWILFGKFEVSNIFMVFLVAIIISITNVLIDIMVLKPIMNRGEK